MPSKIWFSQLDLPKSATIQLLGTDEKLEWEKVGNGFVTHIPKRFQEQPPCGYVWVLKIEK